MRTHFAAVLLSDDTAAKWVRMLRRFVIWAWIDYECSTSIAKFTPVTTIFFLLNKICDGGSSKEPFLKAATLSILIWAYPRETKTNNGNFKNAAILPSKVAYRWRACALILPLCPFWLDLISHAQKGRVLRSTMWESIPSVELTCLSQPFQVVSILCKMTLMGHFSPNESSS